MGNTMISLSYFVLKLVAEDLVMMMIFDYVYKEIIYWIYTSFVITHNHLIAVFFSK